MRLKGLEPPRLSAPDPKSGVATNYTTAAEKQTAKVIINYELQTISLNFAIKQQQKADFITNSDILSVG